MVVLWLLGLTSSDATSVLMVSVDGMRPDYVLEADAHGLRIPFLRKLAAEGAYARGVEGVWPTNTYPSHTTLLTGVLPAEHGITRPTWSSIRITRSRPPGIGMPTRSRCRHCGRPRGTGV